ncbi:MAG TPA: hypothetical protein VLX29_08410 [Nitrospirota bacterium]|nr:hypothetical protein [Nitrospirota bacterium]
MANDGRMLDAGDMLPEIEFDITSGGKVILPSSFNRTWNVFFIYRGHW